MSIAELENSLKDLARVGTLVKDRGYRQVWRFEHDRRAYYLKFYPREGSRLKRMVRGNPAMREFTRLQWLQKAAVPSPRAVATLVGFRLKEQLGDAVIIEAIEPSIQLDQYLNDLALRGERAPDHYALAKQLRMLVHHLGRAKLGHSDLHLGNFLLHERKLFLLDGYAVQAGGLKLNHVLQLGHSVGRYATTTDLQRGWEELGGGDQMPGNNPVAKRQWRKFLERINEENEYFGNLEVDGWTGSFYKKSKHPRRWSALSRIDVTRSDWEHAWPHLLKRIETDQLTIIKRSPSGDVLSGEVVLRGKPVPIVIKRPKRRYWYRYLNEIGRGARPRRAWKKAWGLIVRNIPTAWPLLMIEKRSMGYVTDTLIVFEQIPGKNLAQTDLDAIEAQARDMLFRRVGRILRRIEMHGFAHFDAKASNWIVREDDALGPSPVLVDVDGIRGYRWNGEGLRRLLKSMREHPQYTPEDSKALCEGYAPYARRPKLAPEVPATEEVSER